MREEASETHLDDLRLYFQCRWLQERPLADSRNTFQLFQVEASKTNASQPFFRFIAAGTDIYESVRVATKWREYIV